MDTEVQCVIDCIMTSLVSHIHELWLNNVLLAYSYFRNHATEI